MKIEEKTVVETKIGDFNSGVIDHIIYVTDNCKIKCHWSYNFDKGINIKNDGWVINYVDKFCVKTVGFEIEFFKPHNYKVGDVMGLYED